MSADDPRAIIDHAPMSGFQVMAVLICILLNALDGFDVLAISFAAPGIAEEWSIDRAALGVVLAAELLGMAMGSIVIGALADRYGRRPTILLCLVLMSAGMYLASITRSVDQLLLARLVTGLGIGGMLASTNAMVAEYASRRRRSLAVVLMASGYPLGATLGGWVSSRLLEGGDWRVVFEFGALCTGAFIAVVWFLLPESIQYLSRARPANALQRVNRTLARMGHAPLKRLGRAPPKEQALRFADLFTARFRRVSILLCLGYFFHIMTFYFILKWIPKIVVDMGYAASSAGMVLVWANIGGMIGSLTFGILSQRFALRPLLMAVLIVAFAMVSAFGSGPSTLPVLSALAAVIGCFTNAGVVGFYALIAASYPADVRAGGTGMVIGLGRGGAVLGPVIAGILFTWGAGLLVTSVLMGAGALLAAACLYGLRDPSGDT